MADKAPKRPTEKPVSPTKGFPPPEAPASHDVRAVLSRAVSIINTQIKIIEDKASVGQLGFEDGRLLNSYVRALAIISNDERHTAALATADLGSVSDEELDRLAEEAQQVLGRK